MALMVHYVEKGIYPLDSEGVPYVRYRLPVGDQYNPTLVCQYALGLWEMMPNLSEPLRSPYQRAVSTQVSWLRRRVREDRGFATWTYDFDCAPYSLRSGWISALSQGQAISVLLRSSGPGDVDLAERAYQAFTKSVDDGGVLTRTPEGLTWLEEYPSSAPSLVLNGFIFALFSIWELYEVTRREYYRQAWQNGIRSLEETTRFYDAGYWCYYDRYSKRPYPELISVEYMKFTYIPQFRALHELTGDAFFKDYAQKWERYSESLNSGLMTMLLAGLTAPMRMMDKAKGALFVLKEKKRRQSAHTASSFSSVSAEESEGSANKTAV